MHRLCLISAVVVLKIMAAHQIEKPKSDSSARLWRMALFAPTIARLLPRTLHTLAPTPHDGRLYFYLTALWTQSAGVQVSVLHHPSKGCCRGVREILLHPSSLSCWEELSRTQSRTPRCRRRRAFRRLLIIHPAARPANLLLLIPWKTFRFRVVAVRTRLIISLHDNWTFLLYFNIWISNLAFKWNLDIFIWNPRLIVGL